MPNSLKKLIDLTTIVRLQHKGGEMIFGNPDVRSRFETNQGEQIDLSELAIYWQKKYKSFNDRWDINRQNYRFFYDTFNLFYDSFQQLRNSKINSLNTYSTQEIVFCNQLAGANVFSVYSYGKKCIDIMKEKLCLLDDLQKDDLNWLKKFQETRNKIFEHNFNPRNIKLQIEPLLWTVIATTSWLDILIHTNLEAEYIAQVDYYEDYYKLESIIEKTIKSF